jgi:prolyl 4-hydroxylase
MCATWAEAGECDRNPDYMRGDMSSGLGSCRRSCGVCEPCAARDAACRARNRERAGFLPLDSLE